MNCEVPFTDLAAMTREVRADVEAGWARLLHSGRFIGGEAVEKFEQAWAAYCACRTPWGWRMGPMRCNLPLVRSASAGAMR